MEYCEETIRRIMAEIEKNLRAHLFSDKSLPKKVTVTTDYENARQTLEIKFEEE